MDNEELKETPLDFIEILCVLAPPFASMTLNLTKEFDSPLISWFMGISVVLLIVFFVDASFGKYTAIGYNRKKYAEWNAEKNALRLMGTSVSGLGLCGIFFNISSNQGVIFIASLCLYAILLIAIRYRRLMAALYLQEILAKEHPQKYYVQIEYVKPQAQSTPK